MSWNDVLIDVVNVAFKAIIALAIPYLFSLITQKVKNDKVKDAMKQGEEFVVESVGMVNQTFVDQLKKDGKFDKEAQRQAFTMCFENWKMIASDKLKEAITKEVGNIDEWLTSKIEYTVRHEFEY